MPDVGAIVKCVEISSGKISQKFGKPETYAFNAIMDQHFLNSDQSIDEIK